MAQITDKPIPQFNLEQCDGCGLCVRACQNKAIAVRDGKAAIVDIAACDYSGLCEAVCPRQALSRPFEIVVLSAKDGEEVRKSTNVVENG